GDDDAVARRAIAAASNGIVISDPRRKGNPIIYANPAFERITGYTIGEILGGNCRILQGSDTRQPALTTLRHAISRGKASKVELRNYRKDGSMFWNELSVSPIHDDHGNLIHFIGIQNDISERKLLLEALHTIATGFSGISGLDYFEQVAGWLTGVLGVEYASIGRLLIDEEGTEHIETMAFVAHGHLERNFTYNLAHTPCETVVGKQPCCYPSDIQELFPLDNDLKRLGIEAYIGAPLFRSSNEPIGLLSVMHGSPLKQTDLAATILQIVASRTAAEMERLESEQQLEKARSQAQEYLDVASVVLVALDRQGKVTMINRRGCELLGYPEQRVIGMDWFSDFMRGDQVEDLRHQFHAIMSGLHDPLKYHECPVLTASGGQRLFAWHNSLLHDRQGNPIGTLSSGEDITDRRRAEQETRLAASVFDGSSEGIMITEPDATILRVNPAFSQITGYEAHEVIGKTPALLRSNRHDQAFFSGFWKKLRQDGVWQGEIWNRRKGGEAYPVWQNISAVRNEQGEITQYISIFSDITDRKLTEDRIRHMAHYDLLTGLPNRILFMERCSHAIALAHREMSQMALLFFDLDRFKHINDSLGHPVGDDLLKALGSRLATNLRDADTIARLGGDEFVVLVEKIESPEAAAVVARKLLKQLEQPFSLADYELFVSASIGISIYPDNGTDVTVLIRNADAAMY
ncbi:MAG: hypothetical protein B0D83_00905, partial [Candidatus Sedimenticola endophacoides]